MADQRGMRCVRLAFIQQGLQPSCGAVEEKGFDSGSHIILLPQTAQRNTEEVAPRIYTCGYASSLRPNLSRERHRHHVLSDQPRP